MQIQIKQSYGHLILGEVSINLDAACSIIWYNWNKYDIDKKGKDVGILLYFPFEFKADFIKKASLSRAITILNNNGLSSIQIRYYEAQEVREALKIPPTSLNWQIIISRLTLFSRLLSNLGEAELIGYLKRIGTPRDKCDAEFIIASGYTISNPSQVNVKIAQIKSILEAGQEVELLELFPEQVAENEALKEKKWTIVSFLSILNVLLAHFKTLSCFLQFNS